MADNRGSDPEQYRTVVVLRDGSALLLRSIRPDDEDRLLALFSRFSRHTVYLRFHHVLTHMSREEVARFCTVDYDNSMALVGTVGEGSEEEIIAVGRYARPPYGDTAEVAFVVEDAHQRKGIGTHLLKHLAEVARKRGVRFFEADVLIENQEMVKVLTDSGFRLDKKLEYGVYRVVLDLTPIPLTEVRATERARVTTIASL
jgi:GNAT superfamily N-acetyltransferase